MMVLTLNKIYANHKKVVVDTILRRIVTSSSHNLLQDNYVREQMGEEGDQMLSWCYKL